MRPEFIFFDMGYTLLQSLPSFEHHFCAVLSGLGVEKSSAEVAKAEPAAWVKANTPYVPFTLSTEQSHAFWLRYYAILLEELGLPEIGGFGERLYGVLSDPGLYGLYPDVVPALEELRARGFRLGVISNWAHWLESRLEELNLKRLFDTLVISGTVGLEKPDPAIFTLALERSGVTAARSVHVGDSVECDYRPAAALGFTAVLIDRRGKLDGTGVPHITCLDGLLRLEALQGA